MREGNQASRADHLHPAVFLDRDGTVVEDRGVLAEPSDVVFYPDTVSALRRLQDRFLLFLVTNQPWVARGIITLDQVSRVNASILSSLAEHGVAVTAAYVCPHDREDDCRCIKPRPYFLRKAAREHSVDLERSFTVGDHPHDVEFARSVGARGVYVQTGHGDKHLSELCPGEIVVSGIGEAADWILGNS